MKTIKIAVLTLFVTATMSAQDLKMTDVPTNLTESFQKAHANATDAEWEMDGSNYKVEFDVNKMEHEIWYDKDGAIVKSEKEVVEKELPSAISSVIKSKYIGYKIDSIDMTESNGKSTYEVELEKGWTKEIKVTFDDTGAVLNSVEDYLIDAKIELIG
jgi:uncharacterized membrane protein YkoI